MGKLKEFTLRFAPQSLEPSKGMLVKNPSGTILKIFDGEFIKGKDWIPVKSYLVSNEQIKIGDKVIDEQGNVYNVEEEDDIPQQFLTDKKIEFGPEQIGYIKHLSENSGFLSDFEDIPIEYINEIVKNSGKCYVELIDIEKPKLINNKVVINIK